MSSYDNLCPHCRQTECDEACMQKTFTVYEVSILSGEITEHTAIGETDKRFVLTGGRGVRMYGKDTKWSVLRRDKREAIEVVQAHMRESIAGFQANIERIRERHERLEKAK